MKIELIDKLVFTFACLVSFIWQVTVSMENVVAGAHWGAFFAFISATGYAYFGSKLWWFYK